MKRERALILRLDGKCDSKSVQPLKSNFPSERAEIRAADLPSFFSALFARFTDKNIRRASAATNRAWTRPVPDHRIDMAAVSISKEVGREAWVSALPANLDLHR